MKLIRFMIEKFTFHFITNNPRDYKCVTNMQVYIVIIETCFTSYTNTIPCVLSGVLGNNQGMAQ